MDETSDICIQILTSGKKKGVQCSQKIVCKTHRLCARHNNIRLSQNYKKHGDYGNPDQADLWLKWVMSVGEDNNSSKK